MAATNSPGGPLRGGTIYSMTVQQRYLENGSSTHRHFITKLMLITAQSFTTTQRLHGYEFDKTVLSSARLLSVA